MAGTVKHGNWWWGLVLTTPMAAAYALTIVAAARPGGSFTLTLVIVPAWFLSGLMWLVLLFFRDYRRSFWALVPPLAGALTLALVSLDVPMKVAFLVSEPALTRYARSLPEDEQWASVRERVGLFSIDGVQRWNGATQLRVAGSGGMLEECGFAYLPVGDVRVLDVSSAEHLSDGWYAVCVDFD
ncbi:hypothetical protein [Microbispora siamensis]|uniref:Uncharacterized protein n=1 Tax=Microbispora siamensis TaxID=564413 RepID=A0ABQ4GE62_9ACTN|nr:hypothetical protein [Microbispora siamensis]GIH59680.1 hypothetical protein Msi02_04970 [Microbispora siamensis]